MENIYIDTSIFESNNFFESKRINEILKLAEEGYINIILPELTYNEIKNRISKNVSESIKRLNKNRNEVRILRNVPSLAEKFEQVNDDEILKEFLRILDENLAKANVKIIPYPTINIKSVFDSYFNKVKPFSSGLKKDEFPDAFALNSLEEWCKENGTTCLIFSKDNDLVLYESDFLKYIDYEDFLNDKLEEVENEKHNQRLKLIAENFKDNYDDFKQEISNWLYQQLDDDSKYYNHSNYLEIYDLEIISNEVINIEDYKIVSVSDDVIYLESNAIINYQVEITYDDDSSGFYDDEDKVWHYFDTVTETIEKERIIKVGFKFEIPIAGEEFAEVEIDEINQGSSLKI